MVNGRCRQEWDHTASLLVAIASLFAGKGHRPTVEDFHPYMRRERQAATAPPLKVGIDFLIAIAKQDQQGIAKALMQGK